jgi:glycosyltransferase involved in cell wall biosynthesis
MTGVDRVELAYLKALQKRPEPLFAIVRTTLGYVLLGANGVAELAYRIEGSRPWGSADGLSKLTFHKPLAMRQAESDLRRFALDRCRPSRLNDMLARHLPQGVAYINVGHSNLTKRMLEAVKIGAGGTITVMVHDTIPLDFPQFQRPETPDRFRAMLQRVRSNADLIIYNSEASRRAAEGHMRQWGPMPDCVVAHLGVPIPVPDTARLPQEMRMFRPYFVALGTIEPRKDHAFLLDIWGEMEKATPAGEMPGLVICGARGWNNEAVFKRLDGCANGGLIREYNCLSDGAVAALILGSHGLLFPSKAEGYGLPPLEAAALGVPVVCLDLPVYRETLGDYPVYAKETDRYQWMNIIKALVENGGKDYALKRSERTVPTTWDEHFNTVLRFT